ncbi:MAG TPA: hypothetical protein VMS37_03590 [Verrucomicrobiae bacterium]|nr:hypothetical protein [Verrucomicrobiae bacterium]
MREILAFLGSIGLPYRTGAVNGKTFVPGIQIESGVLVIDPAQLLYPGDLLHEAGHLALMEPARRAATSGDAGSDGGEEIGAIAWSYAAALHIGIDPRIVFHDAGYRGNSVTIVENFRAGLYIGVPMLQWKGLALDERRARDLGLPPYPYMLRWLCE